MTSGIHTYRDINRKTAEVAVTMYHGVQQLFPSAPPQQADLYLRLMRLAHQHMSDILSQEEGGGAAPQLRLLTQHYPHDLPNPRDARFLHVHRWPHPTAAQILRRKAKAEEHRAVPTTPWPNDDLAAEPFVDGDPESDLDHDAPDNGGHPTGDVRAVVRPRPRFH